MIELKPNSRKILEYITTKYSEDPSEWVANWQIEINTAISRSNISKYTKLLVSKNLIERKYQQLGGSREVYYKLTNSKEVLIFSEKTGNGVEIIVLKQFLKFFDKILSEDMVMSFSNKNRQDIMDFMDRELDLNLVEEVRERYE